MGTDIVKKHLNCQIGSFGFFEQPIYLLAHDKRSPHWSMQDCLVNDDLKPRWIVASQDLLPGTSLFNALLNCGILKSWHRSLMQGAGVIRSLHESGDDRRLEDA